MTQPIDSPHGHHHWALLSNHALVLMCVAMDPDMLMRDIAEAIGITERATQAIVTDLYREGYLERSRVGRRNRYRVLRRAALDPHPFVGATVGDLLDLLLHQRAARRAV